ncbi:MAG: CotH kinase family protein [Lachnospiraceae bacterium]|nr:CotH kinase family protein [Lachnospiraceae bacterium]
MSASMLLAMSGCGTGEEQQVTSPTVSPVAQETVTAAPTVAPIEETTSTTMVEPTKEAEPAPEPANAISEEIVQAEATKDTPLAFSDYTGVYEETFYLTMDAFEENAEIYYTLDGSDPAESKTAVKYAEAIPVERRENAENVVSAIDPVLFSGSFNYTSKNAFKCEIDAPENPAVDKCTVVRAVAKYSDGTFSDEVSATYFIGTMEEHIKGLAESCEAAGTSLAVVSISADYDDFFGVTNGIYMKGNIFEGALKQYIVKNGGVWDGEVARSLDANYKRKGRSWEREVRVSFMECTPEGLTEVLAQTCGVRIQGNYSRSDLQKGLRLYAREEYGKKNFKYPFFGEDYVNRNGETMDKFKTLVLRNGGNCAFTSKYNDTYWQSLVTELDCGTQKSRPCVVYLNGEYWGLYVLQEDYIDNHMENLYGVDNSDVVIYKGDAEALELGYKLDEGDIPEGEDETYYFKELLSFFDRHENLESESDYAEFCTLVDPQSVMDYFAVQCWINNKWDWPGKNWSMWRTITSDGVEDSYGDGRWRFLFYDMEFGGVSGGSDARTNTIKEDNYKPEGLLDFDTDNPAVLCFAYLMTNAGFRNEFNQTLLGLSEGVFEKEAALNRLEEFEAMYGPLFEQFFERYPGTGSTENALEGGYASSRCIREFLEKRENYIQQMVDYIIKKRGE